MSGDPDPFPEQSGQPEASGASEAIADFCPRIWQHDVNNALNSALLATHVAGRLWSAGDPQGAIANLDRAVAACIRLHKLLEQHPALCTEADPHG